jgi:diguanylate cyclase (GGDEF)-like protein
MFASLSARVACIGLIVVVALASLAALLADASHETRESFRLVTHSAEVIETTEAAMSELRDAEAAHRGFMIAQNPAYIRSTTEHVSRATRNMARVLALTSDNARQHDRARELARLITLRSAYLRQPMNFGQSNFASTMAVIIRGREAMDAVSSRSTSFLAEERRLQASRREAAEQRLTRGKSTALAGALAVALLVIVGSASLIRSIRRPLNTMMKAMNKLGSGELNTRIDTSMGSVEFSQLAQGYNAMAERLKLAVADQDESERRLQIANAELQRNTEILRERGDAIELLGGMAHRMQAARTDEELAAIIGVFVPRVLPCIPGALYAHNNSRNLLAPIASWGGLTVGPEGFAPDQCWALRRGQSHCVTQPGHDIVCAHATDNETYHCEPLLAAGEVIGVLYLQGIVSTESRFHLTVLTENIASALVNHRLQRSLREQTIRDPLTGLFNRRYMDEALTLEIARASRSGAPLSLIMCDIDHFKRFNDDFGHDAGDAVLQAVSAEMRTSFRDGDVVCRYGGEEFTVIAPGTSVEALMDRVEKVRHAINELHVRHNDRTLGSTSMSFGIATWDKSMDRDGSTLVQTADAALYQAKREGRNRALVHRLAA